MHTPGPWNYIPSGKDLAIVDVPGALICSIRPDPTRADMDFANARLIAAAPDLLQACKDAFASSCRRSETQRKWTMLDQKTHELLKKAIATAEGRSIVMRIRSSPRRQTRVFTTPLQTFLQYMGKQTRADSPLQRSAPDLLAACKRLMATVDTGEAHIPCSIGLQISTAITKAERI